MNQEADRDLSVTLVATKLAAPPPIPGYVGRPELVSRLVRAPGSVTLISAPAGWGKTSLVSAWISATSEERPFAFVHLEPADNNTAVFWMYVIAALQTVHPELMPGAKALLRNPEVDPQRQIVPALINELCDLAEPVVLVLDDYHVITQPNVHDSITYLSDHLPPTTHLVLATRTDPPLPLGRLRASGELSELRASDLSFTDTETTDLLYDRFGLAMDVDDVSLLRRRTEGWPAALHLAGLSLQVADDRHAFVERFAGNDRNVADYLTNEVLDQLPAERREFLLRTSVLDHLTGPLCDVVAEVNDSVAILEELYHDNLFVVPLDSRRQWYRYHELFADWLRHELRRTDPTAIAGLHSRASRWHSDNNSLAPAISHAMAANEYLRAADLMDGYLTDLATVQWGLVRQWLSDLPSEVGSDHPMVATAQLLFALSQGDFTSGRRWADIADAAIGSASDHLRPTIEKTVALFRALSDLVAGDMGKAREAFVDLANTERSAASSIYAMASGYAGMATFWTTGPRDAIVLLRNGAAASKRLSLTDGGVTALLADAYAEVGDWQAAEATVAEAFQLPRPAVQNRFPTLMAAHYANGKGLLHRGDRMGAMEEIREGLDQARKWVEPIFVAYGLLALADAHDGYVEKRDLVREARTVVDADAARGRIGDLVAHAERELAIHQPTHRTAGTVHVEVLTAREHDVMRLLAKAMSLREIGTELFVSHNTVKGYTKAIYRKLGVSSREAAVETARRLEII